MIEQTLSTVQIHVLQRSLTTNREALRHLVSELGAVTGTKHDCRILDIADSASLNEMQRRAASLILQHTETLGEIDAALLQIENGRYGYSEKTGDPISFERLEIIPWARTGAAD